jgi:hypothetical protein
VCFIFIYNFCLKYYLLRKIFIELRSRYACRDLHVKCPKFSSILIKFWMCQQSSVKYWNVKFNENSFSCSRVVTRRQADSANLVCAFNNYLNERTSHSINFNYLKIWSLYWIDWDVLNLLCTYIMKYFIFGLSLKKVILWPKHVGDVILFEQEKSKLMRYTWRVHVLF